MEKKNLIISLDLNDEKSKKLAEVLGSETCKKIIDYLSEKPEACQKDISEHINTPLNTIDYNLKKLLDSGIVEKTKNFFWSIKGKKIPLYRLSNKSILISPKKTGLSSKAKSILPVAAISGLLAILLRQYLVFKEKVAYSTQMFSGASGSELAKDAGARTTESFAMDSGAGSAPLQELNPVLFSEPHSVWIWFLAGMLIAIAIFTIINWRKI